MAKDFIDKIDDNYTGLDKFGLEGDRAVAVQRAQAFIDGSKDGALALKNGTALTFEVAEVDTDILRAYMKGVSHGLGI